MISATQSQKPGVKLPRSMRQPRGDVQQSRSGVVEMCDAMGASSVKAKHMRVRHDEHRTVQSMPKAHWEMIADSSVVLAQA